MQTAFLPGILVNTTSTQNRSVNCKKIVNFISISNNSAAQFYTSSPISLTGSNKYLPPKVNTVVLTKVKKTNTFKETGH